MRYPTPIEVVNGFNTAWARGDIEEAISYIAEDCVYELHISDEALAHGGKTAGREKIAAVLRQIRKDFEYILYPPFKLNAGGETVRHQVEFMYRHLQSGEVLAVVVVGAGEALLRPLDQALVALEGGEIDAATLISPWKPRPTRMLKSCAT